MASRTVAEPTKPTMQQIAEKVGEFTVMAGKDATTVTAVAEALNTYESVIMTVLNDNDPEGTVVDGSLGELWLAEDSDENASVEPPKPTPAPNPAERFKARKGTAKPAVTPVLDNAGEPITVPVAEGSSERRELDASLGEHVISEESVSALVNRINNRQSESENPVSETTVTGSWINEGEPTHFIEYKEGDEITGHTLLPASEFIASPPPGVTPNIWELYKTGATMPARIFWGSKVAEQMAAYAESLKAAEAVKVEESPAPEIHRPAPIDPVTGKPFDFSDVPF